MSDNSLHEQTTTTKRKFRYASEVKPEKVDWLWKPRLARGELTLMVGDPDLGKSLLSTEIAAEMTRRGYGVVIMSPEDSEAHTIVPRLEAAKADLDRVILLSQVDDIDKLGNQYERSISFPQDTSQLEDAIQDSRAVLVIIDPILAMVNVRYDGYRDQHVRAALNPALAVASRHKCSVLGIMHLNKDENKPALYRAAASIAFIGRARIGLFVVPDPDNPANGSVLINHKNNLAPKEHTKILRFSRDGIDDERAVITWHGESAYTEDQLLNLSTSATSNTIPEVPALIQALKEHSAAMTLASICGVLDTGQSANAVGIMVRRKAEQGVIMRVGRGLYTYTENERYKDSKNRSDRLNHSDRLESLDRLDRLDPSEDEKVKSDGLKQSNGLSSDCFATVSKPSPEGVSRPLSTNTTKPSPEGVS